LVTLTHSNWQPLLRSYYQTYSCGRAACSRQPFPHPRWSLSAWAASQDSLLCVRESRGRVCRDESTQPLSLCRR